jgi:hypothetical protein
MVRRKGDRRIIHTHGNDCPCEPILGIVCQECDAENLDEFGKTCDVCRGLGIYRLPLGVAPRDDMVQIPICRDHHEGKYPIHTSDPPGSD